MSRIAVPLSLLFALIPLSESALQAQRTDVPRTRTLPGIESPAFPYAQPEDVGLSSDALERLGDEVAGWVANGDVVGAELLIIKAGRAVFHEAYGWGDRERNEPVERNAVWSIKSMSKPVTATAVLMLAEEGKLSLDDPVSRYIPGFAGDQRTTVRHLLAQTSGDDGGHGGGGYNVYFFDSLRDWVTDWSVQKPTATFGEFRYSNFNYAALGYIVELVAGVPVETFTERRVLQPLGMTDTYTVFTPAAPWAERVPSRYRWDQEALQYERYWSNRDLQPWTFYPAALGLWGTAMDYARFMSMWLNRGEYEGARLLAERTAETALEPHGFLGEEGLYGYGWFVEAAAGGGMPLTFRHGGADGTVAFAVPEDDAMVIYLSHSGARGQNALQNRVAMLGLFEYPGPWMAWAKESGVVAVRLAPEERTSYTGTYVGEATGEGAPPMHTRVWEEDGRLNMSLGEAGALAIERTHLVPLGDHRFAQGRYRGDRLEGVDTVATTRFAVSGGVVSGVEHLVGSEVEFSARRVDSDSVLASLRAERSRVSVADIVAVALETGGIDAARARHREIRSSRPDSVRFAESLLDALGHRLLHEERVPEAVAVFEMNVESWPESSSAHGSLADAFRAAGNLEDASTGYERAIELAEQAEPMHLRTFRARLEEVKRQIEGAEEVAQRPSDGPDSDVPARLVSNTARATPSGDPAGPTAWQQAAVADTIRSLAVESMSLWNRLDPDAWLTLFADSVRWYYHATSLDRAGVEDMVRGLMSFIRDSRYRVVAEPDVAILGPDAAVASFPMVQSATGINGVELEEPTGLTFVYQRRASDWKIVRVHESIEPPPDSVTTATIMARTRELAASWERLDADAYLAHFSDDLTFYFQGSRVARAGFEAVVRDAIASLREATFDVVNPEVEVLGPNAAVISFELREVMLDESGATTELNGAMTLVYERRDGRWLVVRAHESLR